MLQHPCNRLAGDMHIPTSDGFPGTKRRTIADARGTRPDTRTREPGIAQLGSRAMPWEKQVWLRIMALFYSMHFDRCEM